MFDLVDEQLSSATNALVSGDTRLINDVLVLDKRVDRMELKIDHACETLLARSSLTLVDVQELIAAMRVNGELERIGDLCKKVIRAVCMFPPAHIWLDEIDMINLADAVRRILRLTCNALLRCDRLGARQVLAYDLQVDRAWRKIPPIVATLCQRHPNYTEALIQIVMVGKSLERIADHAKSIARSIIYAVEGTDIRHPNPHVPAAL